jgi:hypothetical protein
MASASYDQIVGMLGDVDPLFVKRLEDTGASVDEVGEALGDLESEREGGARRMASSARVAEVRAILEEMFDEPEDEEGSPGSIEAI